MKYVGSKKSIFREFKDIILKNRKKDQWYVEPFAGGFNSIIQVGGLRMANDINFYITQMFLAFQLGWEPPNFITRKEFYSIKENKKSYAPELVGWVLNQCSFNGKWNFGYMGVYKHINYQTRAIKRLGVEREALKNIVITNKCYTDVKIPKNSIVYCDPPYKGYSYYYYSKSFDTDLFWIWCREQVQKGHSVFVSEENAPKDFKCIWCKEISRKINITGRTRTEKLFVHRSAA